MQYKCKVTVIDKKCFSELQTTYLADPKSGPCPFYQIGDEFLFERYGEEDTFWREGNGTQCAEAWDCISRYIYTALQGGSIMRGWTNDEHIMIACCNDGTRPVIFRIERQDYKVLYLSAPASAALLKEIAHLPHVQRVENRMDCGWIEVFTDRNTPVTDENLYQTVEKHGNTITKID